MDSGMNWHYTIRGQKTKTAMLFKMSNQKKKRKKRKENSKLNAWATSHHGSCAAGLLSRKHSVGFAEDKCHCRRQREKANIMQAGTTLAHRRNQLIFLNLLPDWAARSKAARLISLWEKHWLFLFIYFPVQGFFDLKKNSSWCSFRALLSCWDLQFAQ